MLEQEKRSFLKMLGPLDIGSAQKWSLRTMMRSEIDIKERVNEAEELIEKQLGVD